MIHNLFQFDGDMKSKLDFSKETADSRNFLNLDTLLLDEARGIYILPCRERRVRSSQENKCSLDIHVLIITLVTVMYSTR